ncbi:GNAT family N-acetyltransferase [Bacillus sp. B1-b2]|uniref:GNAT family N-acetyltransferase n=1 Tax=Bacillus sp. B1-b2 TaxID=2653201 RepID=UPI00126207E8|nr:GNAT family N-acetyltransferase [Bacillus sp. B1-b2]KAB7672650.1 GNAT family N-acetyltransferase [Bacillus sp. B1-b2]
MLSKNELEAIKCLQEVCENEGYQLKLNHDMLENRKEGRQDDFFHYEGDTLVGFLGCYYFGSKVEMCGMVHPDYRRKGIFSFLLKNAVTEAEQRKASKVLLNAPSSSVSGKDFLRSVACKYAFSEYQMKWHEKELHEIDDVILRDYDYKKDQEIEIQLDIQGFGIEEQDAREYVETMVENEYDHRFIIEAEGRVAGKIRVSEVEKEAWIYGFAIFPELRGKGIGRKVLTKVVKMEHQKGLPIFLEVEAKNAQALTLYESCGFKSYHSQDYYSLLKSES